MKAKFSLAFLVLTLLSACAYPNAEYMPPTSFFYTGVKLPLKLDFDGATKLPRHFGKDDVVAVQYYILGASIGDGGLDKAMKDGWVEKASDVEVEYKNVLGIYQKVSVLAYGKEEEY